MGKGESEQGRNSGALLAPRRYCWGKALRLGLHLQGMGLGALRGQVWCCAPTAGEECSSRDRSSTGARGKGGGLWEHKGSEVQRTDRSGGGQ